MAAKKKASATGAKGGKEARAPKPRASRPEPSEAPVHDVLQPPATYTPMVATTNMTLQERARAFSTSMNKDGRKRVVAANDAPNLYELRRPTGILTLDRDIGGGFPAGGFCVIAGPDNCLDSETFIQYETRKPTGERSNHKGGTIKKLYERFHGLMKEEDEDLIYSAPSMNDEGCIIQNRILDVVNTGEKLCYELKTVGGQRIIATAQHKFFNGEKYVRLSNLEPGDTVVVHLKTTNENPEKSTEKSPRAELYVKSHGTAPTKKVTNSSGTYFYKRLVRARAVVEAAMNGLTLEDYIERLNAERIAGLKFLTRVQIVHHIDEDTTNDALDNLMVVTRAEHMLEHLKDKTRENYFRFIVTEDQVESITPVGKRATYDIKMAAPFHNYVADNIVVHNSGKTWLLMLTYVMHQKLYGDRACIAHVIVEGGFDYRRALQMGLVIQIPDEVIAAWNQERIQLGMAPYTQDDWLWFKRQIGVFHLLRGSTGEEVMHVVLEAVKENLYNIIGIDSVSILLPEADEAKDVGETPKYAGNASMLTDFMKKYTPHTTGINEPNPTTVIGIMQVRANSEKSSAPSYIAKFMKDWHATGAWSIKHGKLVDVQIWDGSLLKRVVHGQNQTYGKALHWRIEKGKAGCHDNVTGETEYRYDLPTGHDHIWNLITAGVARGVFREERGRIEVYNPITWEKTTFGGHPDYATFSQQLMTDIEFELSMRYYVLAASGVQCLYRPLA